MPPLQKRYPTVQVPRLLTDAEQRVFEAVQSWARQGRSSTATTPLSELIDDGDWSVPNIRLSHRSGRAFAWWKVCALHAIAAHRDQLADFKALIEAVEGQETDDLSLARGLALAAALIRATAGRERKFVKQRRLDEPPAEEAEEQLEQEAG